MCSTIWDASYIQSDNENLVRLMLYVEVVVLFSIKLKICVWRCYDSIKDGENQSREKKLIMNEHIN